MGKDVTERMPLSGIGFKEKGKRENISLKTKQSVKFFNTNPHPEMKSRGEFYGRN
jgi:hypothetical protein